VVIEKTSHLIPTWQDIDVLESIQTALGQLADFTDMLSAENFVTMSSILPVLHILQHEVLAEAESDTQLTQDIKARILSYLEKKYSDPDISELLNISCFLDPGFTTEYVHYHQFGSCHSEGQTSTRRSSNEYKVY